MRRNRCRTLVRPGLCIALIVSLYSTAVRSQEPSVTLTVLPDELRLIRPESSEQLVVLAHTAGQPPRDVTREVRFIDQSASDTLPVASVSSAGQVVPLRDGQTTLRIEWQGQVAAVDVQVQGFADPRPISFRQDVIPVLSKAGCNSGACHGKAEGQNGFRLSVFGFDPVFDHQALVMEGAGRRIFPASPDRSLLLRKATGETPHGGGQKIEPGSRWYRRLSRWIAEGAALDAEPLDPVVAIDVEPTEVSLAQRATQQLRVVAVTRSGTRTCVTAEADYQSNNDVIAEVNRDGLVSATELPGEAAILVRFAGHVSVCRITRPNADGQFIRPDEFNFVDRLVADKLQRLRIPVSPLADDATYVRRVYLDTIGTLPTAAEVREFLDSSEPGKRELLVDQLLRRPEYADYWAQKWADLLQVDKDTITPRGAVAMTRWIRRQVARNTPYDEFARAVITARGSVAAESPAGFFQVQGDPEQLARSVSQLFLGVRIECAQCHHHPFERWDQQDYFALAGFFTGIERPKGADGQIKIVPGAGKSLTHPRTGTEVLPAGLGATPIESISVTDRRALLADWMTSPDNRYFARTMANRLWAHYFGRGLVEPVDDLRATNPASNEPLLEALAQQLIDLDYDLQALTRILLNSRTYQLSTVPVDGNERDEQNYSHAAWKPLPAEVLLDAISQATGVPHQFNGWPVGYRAIQVWDNKLPSHFLEVFGRPSRQTVCACERGTEPSIAQALHLMNSPETMQKIQHRDGRTARLARSELAPEAIVDELYLTTLSRFPSDEERELMVQVFASSDDRREATEDVLWTLLNLREFVFNH